MEEKKSGNLIVKLALVLFAVAAIMALALGIMNELTKDTIAEIAAEKTATAYANVLEAADYSNEVEVSDSTITKMVVACDANGEQVGYVAETTFSGAQGMITMVVGLDNDLCCTGIYVTEHSETSGLGAKAAETSEGAWRDGVVGQGDGVAVDKDGGEVASISGATITSRAVCNEIQAVINAAAAIG